MRTLLSILTVALMVILVNDARSGDKAEKGKEVTLTGKITCAKCDLGEAKSCATVIVAKDVTYYFDKASHKKHHGAVCTESKEGTVTGTVSKDGDKTVITVESVEFK